MEAKERPLRFLTLEGKINIPFFQRTYVWTADNWEELLAEFKDETRNRNFLGTIILKQLPSLSGEPKKLEVIDGQQRLTTLSILLKAIYDSLSEENKNSIKNEIMPILFYKKDLFRNEEIRIEHSYVDSDAYEQVMTADVDLDTINYNSHRIYQCYKFFRERLNGNEEGCKKLLNRILDHENKMLVVIDLNENDDEQGIFDTLNTAGVRLTVAEIVKNAIFKELIQTSNRDAAIQFYRDTWERTFLNDRDTVNYWETERQTGRLKRNNIEILLHSFAVINDFFDPDKHTLADLSKLFKEKVNSFSNQGELEQFIKDIIVYAKIYREKMLVFESDVPLSFDDDVMRLLHILDTLEISTFHPFILFTFKKYQEENGELKRVLKSLEKYVIRNMLSKNTSKIKNYNKLCKSFIENEDNLVKELSSVPFNGDVEQGLKNMSNKDASLILFWIELYRRHKDQNYDLKELKYDYSLEHIMPQNWMEYWNLNIVPHPDETLHREEQEKDRSSKIYWIGNMTLLRSRLNSSLRNYDFVKKMNGEGRKKGIKNYADLSITKDDIVEPFNNGNTIWNEKEIKDRTEKLINEIKEIWGD